MREEILRNVQVFRNKILSLKENSNYFPEILSSQDGKETFFSTIVRKEIDGVWYSIHCVESCKNHENNNYLITLQRLIKSCFDIQHLYQLNGHEDVDKLQISEQERLLQ